MDDGDVSGRTLTAKEKAAARRLARMMRPILDVHPTITLQVARTYLAVLTEEGQTVSHYVTKLENQQPVTSRHLQDLGERNRYRREGLCLVAPASDTWDRRLRRFYRTPRGRALAKRLTFAAFGKQSNR